MKRSVQVLLSRLGSALVKALLTLAGLAAVSSIVMMLLDGPPLLNVALLIFLALTAFFFFL